jgi:succinoglycan biosynthesis protein ExoM
MKHITVCICTFKRPYLLKKLLDKLINQQTGGLFCYSVVVVDNDQSKSAQYIVESFQQTANLDIKYLVESEQNIALARNRAVEKATGDFIAFIDDDEFPDTNWLLNLFRAYLGFKADGILGPVLPYYEVKPPQWIIKGRFHERPSHKTGTVLPWTNTRTGNVLLKRNLFDGKENMFRSEFGSGGEDRDFFKRMIDQGCTFVWCAEAPVYELVPPERYKRSFMLRRALLRGKTPYNHRFIAYTKTLIAIPLYTLILPFLFFIQHHLFMKYLISYFDHLGRLLAFLRLNVIREKYVIK